MSQREILNIIDANAYLFKSYCAYEPRLDKKGIDRRMLTGLMDAVISVINHATKPEAINSLKQEPINHFCFVFDPPDGSAYRKALYPEYKATRPPKEEEFVIQSNYTQKVLKELVGIPILIYPGYEADDTVGSLANLYKKDYKIRVFSVDKDLAQLVDDDVTLVIKAKRNGDYARFLHFDKDAVFQEFGVYPERIPDFLALMGDTVDNLPGLENIGKVKAAKIISEYISIEHLLAYKDQIENKGLKIKIEEAKETLPFVKMLATIKCDLPIEQAFLESCDFSANIRNSSDYADKFLKMEKFFNWPSHYRQFFTS